MNATRALARLRADLLDALSLGEAFAEVTLDRVARRRGDPEHVLVVLAQLRHLEGHGLVRSRRAGADATTRLDRARPLFALTELGARELAHRRRSLSRRKR